MTTRPRKKPMQALPIPARAVIDSGAILGKKGAGKSSVARVIFEHEVDVGHRCCFIDPMGDAAGIRLNPDGTPSRFQNVIILGGPHADIAISDDDGGRVGKLVGTTNASFLIDLSSMMQSEQLRFMSGFADKLYDDIGIPVTLFVDEAHLFAPQERGDGGASAMLLNRMNRLNSQGRKRGIFLWLMTQRPARINKNTLGGTETLIAMKMTMPRDIDAMEEWFAGHDPAKAKEIRVQLAKLSPGEAIVWSPGLDFLERVQFPMHSTFDSGKTPEHGEKAGLVNLPTIDVSAIAKAFGVTTTEDPRDAELRALRAELAAARERLDTERRQAAVARDRHEAVALREERLLQLLIALQMRIGAAIGSARIEALPITEPYEQYLMVPGEDGIIRPLPREGDNRTLAAPARRRMVTAKVPQKKERTR